MFAASIRKSFKNVKGDSSYKLQEMLVVRLNQLSCAMLEHIGAVSEQVASEQKQAVISPEIVRVAVRRSVPPSSESAQAIQAAIDHFLDSTGLIFVPVPRCRKAAKFTGKYKVRKVSDVMLAAVNSAFIEVMLRGAIKTIGQRKTLMVEDLEAVVRASGATWLSEIPMPAAPERKAKRKASEMEKPVAEEEGPTGATSE